MIQTCKICNRTYKTPNAENRVYPNDYDHNACEDCNQQVQPKTCKHMWHMDKKTSFMYCSLCMRCVKDGVMMTKDEYIAKHLPFFADVL